MERRRRSAGRGPSTWNADATADHPVGPDDAGNAVMHAIGILVAGWRWVRRRVRRSVADRP